MLSSTQGALPSIFCNRLLLNIRGVYEPIDESIPTLSTRTKREGDLPGHRGSAGPVKLRRLKGSHASESDDEICRT
jgi:hypothetical protein